MADEAIGCDLESPARSRSGGSVHRSQDRDCTDLASHSAVNRSRSYDCATPFKSETAAAALSRRFESGTGLHLLCRPEGATLNEIRNQTGWQAHTVRGFISRTLSKQSRNVRSFERDGERVYRLKV